MRIHLFRADRTAAATRSEDRETRQRGASRGCACDDADGAPALMSSAYINWHDQLAPSGRCAAMYADFIKEWG